MPRIIFKCNYLKNKSVKHISHTVRYIATRDGVDKMTESEKMLPATICQQQMIEKIVKDLPGTLDLFEYTDYINNQTEGNATDLINHAIDNNYDLVGKKKNYVDYIANRPRVEKVGTHGLFSATDDPIIISKVADEISKHTGNVWTNIISIRREDATRLGYDNAKSWIALLRSHANEIATNMKIAPENFRWYAAMHNESHHPHVHLIVYSINPKEAYLSENGIENIRAELAKDIFRQDLMQIYTKQTKIRDDLKEDSKTVLAEITSQIENESYLNEKVEQLMLDLSHKLKNIKGKLVYGYFSPPIKATIEQIVDELAKDERLIRLYDLWYEQKFEVLKTYTDTLPPKQLLSQQNEFKSIKNLVIMEALKIKIYQEPFENSTVSENAGLINQGGDVNEPGYYNNKKKEYEDQKVFNPIKIELETDPIIPTPASFNPSISKTTTTDPATALNYHIHIPSAAPAINHNSNTSVAVANLFRHCSRILNNEISNKNRNEFQLDRKLQREIEEKKQAQGIRI